MRGSTGIFAGDEFAVQIVGHAAVKNFAMREHVGPGGECCAVAARFTEQASRLEMPPVVALKTLGILADTNPHNDLVEDDGPRQDRHDSKD